MPVRLRLSLHGQRNARTFNIVAIDSRRARNDQPIEQLGSYSPAPNAAGEKRVEWSERRIRYWLGVGAQPSGTVLALLERAGIVPRAPKPWDDAAAKLALASSPAPESTAASPPTPPPTPTPKRQQDARERQLGLMRAPTHSVRALRVAARERRVLPATV